MFIDMGLFAVLAFTTIFIGGYLWMRPRKNVSKNSGVGDIGQND